MEEELAYFLFVDDTLIFCDSSREQILYPS